jgi:hypothetical protein
MNGLRFMGSLQLAPYCRAAHEPEPSHTPL